MGAGAAGRARADGEAVLDVACGPVTVTRLAAARSGPAGRVTGCDLSPAMLGIAAQLGPVPDGRPSTTSRHPRTACPFPTGASTSGCASRACSSFPTGPRRWRRCAACSGGAGGSGSGLEAHRGMPPFAVLLEKAEDAGHACLVIDGTLIPAGRVAAGRLFYSGENCRRGMNPQVIAGPDGESVWLPGSPPGAVRDLTAGWIWASWPNWRLWRVLPGPGTGSRLRTRRAGTRSGPSSKPGRKPQRPGNAADTARAMSRPPTGPAPSRREAFPARRR